MEIRMAFLRGILVNAAPATAFLMLLVALYYLGMLACVYFFMVWRVIYERYHKPPEDGHTRAAEREERWYPMGPLGLVRDQRRLTLKIHIDQLTKRLLR